MPHEHIHAIVAGAPKAGTTSIYEYLKAHPDVAGSYVKNTHHFTDPDFNFEGREVALEYAARNEITSYRAFFPPEDHKVLVEATATYFTSLGTARRIRENLDNAKLIFILRDPTDRFVSAWKVHLHAGVVDPSTTLADYYAMQYHDIEEMRLSITRQALMTGHYAAILERYFEVFDRNDMLVLPFAALRRPAELMGQVSDFLGVDGSFYGSYDFERQNVSVELRNPALHQGVRGAVSSITRHRLMRAPGVKRAVRGVMGAVRPAYRRVMVRSNPTEHDSEVVEQLRAYYAGEGEALYVLTGQRGLLDGGRGNADV